MENRKSDIAQKDWHPFRSVPEVSKLVHQGLVCLHVGACDKQVGACLWYWCPNEIGV